MQQHKLMTLIFRVTPQVLAEPPSFLSLATKAYSTLKSSAGAAVPSSRQLLFVRALHTTVHDSRPAQAWARSSQRELDAALQASRN